MEINNNNYIPKKNDKMKKPDKTTHSKKTTAMESQSFISDSDNHYNEITSRVQRSITKDQVILAGLETVRSFLVSGMIKEENISYLSEIVEKTQFDSEKVLETYQTSLTTALEQGNPSIIEDLIKKVQENIESLTQELEMNEIKKQNLRSLKSFSKEENPAELMQEVLKSLKEEGLPEINITRERIIDLLG